MAQGKSAQRLGVLQDLQDVSSAFSSHCMSWTFIAHLPRIHDSSSFSI